MYDDDDDHDDDDDDDHYETRCMNQRPTTSLWNYRSACLTWVFIDGIILCNYNHLHNIYQWNWESPDSLDLLWIRSWPLRHDTVDGEDIWCKRRLAMLRAGVSKLATTAKRCRCCCCCAVLWHHEITTLRTTTDARGARTPLVADSEPQKVRDISWVVCRLYRRKRKRFLIDS